MPPTSSTEMTTSSALEQLEELAIEIGMLGPWNCGEEFAACLDVLADSFQSSSPDASELARESATMTRRILAKQVPLPRGYTEHLLEALEALGQHQSGKDVTAAVKSLLPHFAVPEDSGPEPEAVLPDVTDLFLAEADACLEQVEPLVLELEQGFSSKELLTQLARALHNLKGSAGMAGHESIVTNAHSMETEALGLVENPDQDRSKLVDILLWGLDDVRTDLDGLRQVRLEIASSTGLTDGGQESTNYLLITSGGQRMAVPVKRIGRVARVPGCAPVPFTPPSVLGLVNLGGELMPLIDLASRLGLEPPPSGDRWALVVSRQGEQVALQVEAVAEIRSVAADLLGAVTDPIQHQYSTILLGLEEGIPVIDTGLILNHPDRTGEGEQV